MLLGIVTAHLEFFLFLIYIFVVVVEKEGCLDFSVELGQRGRLLFSILGIPLLEKKQQLVLLNFDMKAVN